MKKYSKYKDSSIEWIGQIPEEWSIKRVKEIFKLERGKFTHRPRNDERMYNNGVYPFIQTGDVAKANKYVTTFKQTLNDNGIKVSRKFNKGTIVMTIAANIGDVAILDFDCYFPDSLVAFKTKFCTDYFYYLLYADKKALDNVKVTNTQDNLNLERLNGLEKIFPPLNEQIQIANYLDNKTSLIDRKIKLLKRKIKNYKSYRKTLITEIVTKGLDKSVKLKDSGIDWLGDIPEHWLLKRGKEIISEFPKSKISAKEGNKEGKYKFFTSSDVQSKWLDYYEMNEEAIMFSTGGKAGINYCNKKYSYSTDCWCLKIKKFHTKYYYYLFESLIYEIGTIGFKGAGIEHLQKDFIKQGLIPIFSKKEQQQIAYYLDTKTATIDNIVNNIEKQIATLKELNKSLINEVVTGKVKVTA